MQYIPDQIRYSSIRPEGFYSKFKEWPVQPLSSNQYWNPSEILRFLLRLTNGLMDPYRSHLCFKVSVPTTSGNVGLQQVDNSAQSFISQMVIASNNVQIERITEYDTLAAFLTDIGFSQSVCENREWQGMGFGNHAWGTQRNMSRGSSQVNVKVSTDLAKWQSQAGGGGIWPSRIPQRGGTASTYVNTFAQNTTNSSSYVFSTQNFLVNQPNTYAASTTMVTQNGYGKHIRTQYNPALSLNGALDSTTSMLTTQANVRPNVITLQKITQGGNGVLSDGLDYGLMYPSFSNFQTSTGTGVQANRAHPHTAEYMGFERPYNAKFSVGCFQPFISPTVGACQFGYGKISLYPIPTPVKRFHVPLLSSVIGSLIPPDQFCLLPLQALNNLLIELTMNPFAVFTSGYMDVHEYDISGMNNMQKRNFQFSQVFYNLHIYEFNDQKVSQYIQASLAKQITITGCSWQLSAQYQISTGSQVRGNWQINTSAPSLAQIVIIYLSNQYMKYSFCRKQFRLSNNIRSFQLKFNTQYYPSQPFVGNAGNPQLIDNSGDNTDFVKNLLTSYNHRFSTNTPTPRINPFNFAVNSRCYDPSRKDTLLNYSTYQTPTFNSGASVDLVNIDTAMGYSWFHQNRFVGRAAYVYSFQAHGHSRNYTVGVDSRNARPFEVVIDTWPTNPFPTDQTMYAFVRSSVLVVYGADGIKIIGR